MSGWPAELPTILDIGWEGRDRRVATKWQAKTTSRLKTAKWHQLVPFPPLHITQIFTPTYHTKQLIHGQTHKPVV